MPRRVSALSSTITLMAQPIERAIARDAKEPRRRIVGHAAIRPLLQRRHQRVLHRLFGEREMTRRQSRASASRPSAPTDGGTDGRRAWTIDTAVSRRRSAQPSARPRGSRSCRNRDADSPDRAPRPRRSCSASRMNSPPITSRASAYGPSVTFAAPGSRASRGPGRRRACDRQPCGRPAGRAAATRRSAG